MTNAGRIGFLIKGDYDPAATYDFLDVVFYDHASYVAKKLTTGNAPVRNNEYWQVLAEGGTLTENSDISDTTITFTEAENRVNVASGDTAGTFAGKVKKFFSDLKNVAFSGKYSDLTGTPGEFSGASATLAGSSGLVPAPGAGKNEAFLRGDKTWQNLGAAAFAGLANNVLTEAEGFALDARQGKALQKQISDLNSAIEIEKANISLLSDKMNHLTTVHIKSGQATSNHAQCIQDNWEKFPDDMPFIGIITDNSSVFILGYMYGKRQYGCIMYLSYYTGQGMVIRSNGNFTVKEL